VTDSGRRRRWTAEEKIRNVEESFARPRSVASTARRPEIARALLTRWRAEYRSGILAGCRGPSFTPLAVMAEPVSTAAAPSASAAEAQVEIVLGNGRRVLVPASIDPSALARLLPVLDRA
jgi:transposase